MVALFSTRERAKGRIWEVTCWVTAALVGTGIGLALSIVLLPAGILLALLGIAVAFVGWNLSQTAPRLLRTRKQKSVVASEEEPLVAKG